MWIKTIGGYLLNLDNVDYICYEESSGYTKAYHREHVCVTHIISDKNILDSIYDNIARGTKIMEVR